MNLNNPISTSSKPTPHVRSLAAWAATLLFILGSPFHAYATGDQPGFASDNAPPTTYDVYIVAGQSNADGRGLTADLTGDLAHYASPQDDVKIFYVNPINKDPVNPTHNTGWTTFAPGYSVGPGFSGTLPSNRFGFDVSLAKALAARDTERPVAIIKVTQGGTSLRVDWSPTGGDNYMWQTFTNKVPEALAALTADGSTANVRGLFWHQGESDGSNPNYESDLAAFIATVRSFLDEAELPFVIGELERDHVTPPVRSRTYQLAAMAAVANADPHSIVVSTEGLLTTDGTHFTSSGFILFGERLAAAFHNFEDGLTYTVTYDGNESTGGDVPVDPVTYNSIATAMVASAGNLVRSGFFFIGWNTEADGSGIDLAQGAGFVINADTTLYAQWNSSLPPPPTGMAAPLSVVHHIRGEAENPALRPLGYFTSPADTIGIAGAGGNREDRVLVFGYSLPTLPEGATLDGATFHFEISGARDSTGGANLPELHAYLLHSANPSGSGTSFFYHGPGDSYPNVLRIGTTSVAITGADQVNFPDGQQVRAFTLTGEALDLLQSFYDGHTPTRATVYFRFNMSEDPLITQFRRYSISALAASRSVLDLSLSAPANSAPTWTSSPIIQPTATEGVAYTGNLAGFAIDPESDPLTFAKVSGPAWLSVAGDGGLTGTPAGGDVGPNSFVVSVSDGIADPVEAILTITVQSAFEDWTTGEAGEGDHITFAGDSNNDSVPDGIAWLLGAANPTQNARERLPSVVSQENDAILLTFDYLVPGKRGDATLRIEYSATLAHDSWTTVEIPNQSGVVEGVDFTVTPLPETDLNEILASIPSADGRAFVRLIGESSAQP